MIKFTKGTADNVYLKGDLFFDLAAQIILIVKHKYLPESFFFTKEPDDRYPDAKRLMKSDVEGWDAYVRFDSEDTADAPTGGYTCEAAIVLCEGDQVLKVKGDFFYLRESITGEIPVPQYCPAGGTGLQTGGTPEGVILTADQTLIKDLNHRDAMVIVNDYYDRNAKIAKAINDKGGESDPLDTADKMAKDIRALAPAEVTIQDSGFLGNPAKIWADNYDALRPAGLVLMLNPGLESISLNGGDSYKCSDGFETNLSGKHIFTDAIGSPRWAIIYSVNPSYTNNESAEVISAGFFNCLLNLINWSGRAICSDLVFDLEGDVVIPANIFRVGTLSKFIFQGNIRSILIGTNAFYGCTALTTALFPRGLESLTINGEAFRDNRLSALVFEEAGKLSFPAANAFMGNTYLKSASIINCKKVLLPAHHVFGSNIPLERFTITGCEELTITGQIFAGQVGSYCKVSVANPTIYCNIERLAFSGLQKVDLILGEGWNWSIDVQVLASITIESVIQSITNALSREGMNVITLTFPAAIKTQLINDYAELVAQANAKNINIA